MTRIAVLTSGRGAPGLQTAVRAVAAAAAAAGAEVLGLRDGFRGLLEKEGAPVLPGSPAGTAGLGGSSLGTSCHEAMRDPAAAARGAENLKALGAGALVVIGGEGSLQASLALARAGAAVVHVPAAVENDVVGTDACLGVDSALNAVLRRVEARRAEAAEGPVVVAVPGRLSGYVALAAAASAGARGALLPERPFPWDRLRAAVAAGDRRPVLLVSEGAGSASDLGKRLADLFPGWSPSTVAEEDVRLSVPSWFDRFLGTRLGEAAAEAALGGATGRIIAWRSGNCLPIPLESAAGRRRQVAPEVFEYAKKMGVLFE